MEVGEYTYGHGYIRPKFEDTGQPLIIGKYCSIAEDVVVFLGGEHQWRWGSTFPFGEIHTNDFKEPAPEGVRPLKGGVTIGNDVWIGYGVSIMSGTTIGDGAVIAAKSHVTKNVGAYQIWGGNPAKHIRNRFSDEIIEELLKARWWDRPVEVVRKVVPLLQQPMTLEVATSILKLISVECGL